MTNSDSLSKRILHLDLENQTAEVKIHPDLAPLLGGLGLGLGLVREYHEQDPLALTIGPLTGAFPFVSKTAAVFSSSGKLGECFVGGRLALVVRLAGYDGLLLLGKAPHEVGLIVDESGGQYKDGGWGSQIGDQGFSGRRSTITDRVGETVVDGYFTFSESFTNKWQSKNICSLVVSGTGSFPLPEGGQYQRLYNQILNLGNSLPVSASAFRSCSGCPLGCSQAFCGEQSSEALITHCLVGCGYAQQIYEDTATVFSCLSSLGIPFTHDHLEALPLLIYNLRGELAHEIPVHNR